jgi:AcrR family transcriptional regulator
MSNMAHHPQNTSETRERLLQTAVMAFGRRDYDGVAIRQIVEEAEANIAAISYHFGGKRGLYLATVEYLAEKLHDNLAEQHNRINKTLQSGNRAECADRLCELTDTYMDTLLSGELGESVPGIIFREQAQPSEAFEILYQKLLQPMHATLSDLIACHRGETSASRSSLLMAHAMIGQCVIFRIGRTTLLKRLDQPEYTRADIDELKRELNIYCRCLLDAPANLED